MAHLEDEKIPLEEKAAAEKEEALAAEEKEEAPAVEEIGEREEWGNKMEFLLTCIGYAVGFGNVWRFPSLCYENGGGAFLIPYLFFLAICGMPMFIAEVSIGQYVGLGPISCWRSVSPLFKGIGYAMLLMSFLCCIYYNTILAWVLYYLFESFRSNVPWRNCGNGWNSNHCYEGPEGMYNVTVTDPVTNMTKIVTQCRESFIPILDNVTKSVVNCTWDDSIKKALPSEEFWEKRVLKISKGMHDAGEIRWELTLCLLLAWIMVYFCVWKGVKSVGKVVYVTATFPYVVMLILLVRGCTLPGASKGIVHYLKPDFSKLIQPIVWVRAASQICYSLGIGFGSLVAMGSYNKFKNNCYKDAVMVSSINCGTSIFCGFVVFSLLGHMSEVLNLPIDQVAKSGPGLVFVVYPAGISRMPVSTLWAILFFLMLITLGLDSQFAMIEVCISGLGDEYPKYFRKYKEWAILIGCTICFLVGLCMVCQAGPYIFEVFNYQVGGISLLFLAWTEVICIGWVYGADRLQENIKSMIGKRPGIWWTICWKYIAPVVLFAVIINGIVRWDGIKYGGGYVYPEWAEFIGWMLALTSMLCMPIGAAHALWKTCKKSNDSNVEKRMWKIWWARLKMAARTSDMIDEHRDKCTEEDLNSPLVV